MEHLIPMTDFVIYQYEKLKNEEINTLDYAFNTGIYAHFLKKQNKLGYFIPCDENDVPLEFIEYECWAKSDEEYNIYMNKYLEAQKKVLFEGFDISFEDGVILPFLGKYPIGFFSLDNKWVLSDQFKNIEDLIKYKPKLTETAKKEIGL